MGWRRFLVIFAGILLSTNKVGEAINCYTCNSRNGTDTNCHDPYNPALSQYTEDCMEPKKNHIGVFPANFCLKMIGTVVDTGELLVIRRCALDNMDNQCGVFRFQDDTLRGCILTCDYDGCNGCQSLKSYLLLILCFICVTVFHDKLLTL